MGDCQFGDVAHCDRIGAVAGPARAVGSELAVAYDDVTVRGTGRKDPVFVVDETAMFDAQIRALRANTRAVPIRNPRPREGEITDCDAIARGDEDRLASACHVGEAHIVSDAFDGEIVGAPDRAVVIAAWHRLDLNGVAGGHNSRGLAGLFE